MANQNFLSFGEDFFISANERVRIIGKPNNYKYNLNFNNNSEKYEDIILENYQHYLNKDKKELLNILEKYENYEKVEFSKKDLENKIEELVEFLNENFILPKEYEFPKIKIINQDDIVYGEFINFENLINLNIKNIENYLNFIITTFHEFGHSILTVYDYNVTKLREVYDSSNNKGFTLASTLKRITAKESSIAKLLINDILFYSQIRDDLEESLDELNLLDKKELNNKVTLSFIVYFIKQKEELAADAIAEYLLDRYYNASDYNTKKVIDDTVEEYIVTNIISQEWHKYKKLYLDEIMNKKNLLNIFYDNRKFMIF